MGVELASFSFFFGEGNGGAGLAYERVGEEVDAVDGEDGGGGADVRDADGAFEAGRRHSRGIVQEDLIVVDWKVE